MAVPIDSRISLHKLEVFDLVVESGGVSRAADLLGVAQPVVTAHLRSLEERMGTQLFYKEGRKLQLTEAGRAAHVWATDLLRRTREMARDLDSVLDGHQGQVAIGASMSIGSYVLPSVLARFLAERPGIDVRLDIEGAAQAIAATEAGQNDFSLVVIQAPVDTPALVAEQIGHEDLVLVGAPGGPPEGDSLTVADLVDLPYIEAQKGSLRRSFTDQQLAGVGISDRRVVIELGHPEAMKQFVSAGLGVSCLFRSAVERELDDGSLREIRVAGLDMKGPVYLVHRREKLFSAAHHELLAQIRDRFA